MKGVIFSNFAKFVEDNYGLLIWQTLLDSTNPISKGVYISSKKYSDDELYLFINKLSETINLSTEIIEREFGRWLFPTLFSIGANESKQIDNFYDYLQKVDRLIHIEVKKLFPGAETPAVTTGNFNPEKFNVYYSSPRKMCFFCEGLILGCSNHFGVSIKLKQTCCMKIESEVCCIEVSICNK